MEFGLAEVPGEVVMDISVRKYGNVQVISLRGNLQLGKPVDSLRQTFSELLDAGDSQFAVSLAEVPFIDSSGIGILVRCLTTAKQRGGSLKLVNPSSMVLKVLKLVGLLNLFEIMEDEKAAVASFE